MKFTYNFGMPFIKIRNIIIIYSSLIVCMYILIEFTSKCLTVGMLSYVHYSATLMKFYITNKERQLMNI